MHLPGRPVRVSDPYVESVRRMRREKDDWFGKSPHSPLDPDGRPSFKGLRYYDPDPGYRVRATWEPNPAPPVVTLQTSTGEARDYLVAGILRFKLNGVEQTLQGYQVAHGHSHDLFVAFRDATSGKETYGAGRYLEVPLPHHGEAEIDFNMAYNPYCAYNEAYSCPFPPRENWLDVPVRAGERTFKDE